MVAVSWVTTGAACMTRASQQWDANRFCTRLRKLRRVSKLSGEGAIQYVLSAELLEQALELVGRGKKDQAFEQARRLAVGDFQFLPVGLLPDAGEEDVAVLGALELVQLEHLVGFQLTDEQLRYNATR